MITHPTVDRGSTPRWAHQHDFEYWSVARPGLSWPFARQVTLSAIVWSSAAASVAFWGCLLFAIVR
jgi:hypothetical protein